MRMSPSTHAPVSSVARRGTIIAIVGLSGVAVLGSPLAVGARAATRSPGAACTAMTHDKFLEADSVTVNGKKIVITGHEAKFHCGGPDDGHYDVKKKTSTFTINPKAVVKIFRNKDTGARYKTIKASQLPQALKRNADQPVYEYKGKRKDVTKLVEEFHP